jgi:Na+-transporting NADH:ubiquinone oxidoreductase subunit NqrB
MQMNMPMDIANLISVLTGLLVLAACVLLWLRSKTSWVLLALAGQTVSVLCRLVVFVPEAFTQFPALRLVWPVGAMIFAVGLAGHAWTEYEASQRAQQGARS